MEKDLPCSRGEKSADGKYCPYVENELQTQEGWEVWDLVEKLTSQVENRFPLEVALEMGRALGYNVSVLAELLPEVANVVQKIIIDNRQNNQARKK